MSHKLRTRSVAGLVSVSVLLVCSPAHGVVVAPSELAEARRWVGAKFEGTVDRSVPEAGLIVLANHDPVQLNARAGRPLKIAGQQYERGLYCHATSKVVVRLPGEGRALSAIVGVDSNEQTSGGRGSVVFSVVVAGKVAYRSELMREGLVGATVTADLAGAKEFALEVADGGDGISCDQADWAEAKVTLADGREVWLGDLPIIDPNRPPCSTEPPFSFVYDGKPSQALLAEWGAKREQRKLDEQRTEHTVAWTDAKTGLSVRCVGVEYRDFPTVEWTLYFKNTGTADTPILEAIQAIDTVFGDSAQGDYILRHHTGDLCTADSFAPHADPIPAGGAKKIANAGGRPTQTAWPYFNVTWPGEGAIIVLSWAGQWATQFSREQPTGLHVRGGQELTHFKLHPGEEVRSPLALVQFYKGGWLRAQNVWRQWMLTHNLPRPGGKPLQTQMNACSSHQFEEMTKADTASQKFFIDRYLEEKFPLDYWWMDAGWYPNQGGWWNTGTWEVDTNRFPGGFRPITDYAHGKNVRIIVWFEPERVTPGTWLYNQHPEWLLGKDGEIKLLNLGLPEARRWVTDHVNKLLTEQGIDLYRQDYNIDPLPFWRATDSEDRQGITEIRYIEGYFAYWDGLLKEHPGMLIDSCASGGRRNDLETLRRAVPLLRSDYIIEPVGNQCHTYALSLWIPFYGTGTWATDAYGYRSQMSPSFTACYDMRKRDLDYASARKLLGQWRQVGDSFFGDYYPLTPHTLARDAWIGWQFHTPATGNGFVQAFRREHCIYRAADFRLQGLDSEKDYAVTDLDTEKTTVLSGRELMTNGFTVEISARPGTALIAYQLK